MDPVGTSINNFTIFGFDLRHEDWQNHLAAVCNCGHMFFLSLADFKAEQTNPCKCQSKTKEKIDIDKYGFWTVIGKAEYKGTNKYLPCKCECGEHRLVAYSSLKQGRSTSCGCKGAQSAASGMQSGKRGKPGKPVDPDFSGLMEQGKAFMSMQIAINLNKHDAEFRKMMFEKFGMIVSENE